MIVISWMDRPLAKEIVHKTIFLQRIVIRWMGQALAKKIVHTTMLQRIQIILFGPLKVNSQLIIMFIGGPQINHTVV